MSSLDWLLLLVVFFLGFVTSYTDIYTGKIRNRHLLIALAFFVILLPLKYFYGVFSIVEARFFLINLILAIVVAAGIWLLGFWTPGDGKLFFVFSVFLSAVFPAGELIRLASIKLLLFVFIPMFIMLVSVSLFRLSFAEIGKGLHNSFDRKLILAALAVFVINWVFMTDAWKGGVIFLVLVLAYFFLWEYMVYVLGIVALLRLLFDPSVYSVSFVLYFLIILVAIYFLRFFAGEVFFEVFCRDIEIKNLKPGMIPAEVVCKKKKGYEKHLLKRGEAKPTSGVFKPRPEGLQKEDIDNLQKHRKKFNFSCIKVFKTLPFAPFMFLGVVIFVLVAVS